MGAESAGDPGVVSSAGAILSVASWRWIFLLNLPFGLLALVLAVLFLPDDRAEVRPRSLDMTGQVLLAPALIFLLYGTDHAGQLLGQISLCSALLLFAAYFRWAQRKGDSALIDLRLFHTPAFSAAGMTMFLLNGVTFAGQMLLPVWLIHACGVSSDRTGLFMLPLGLGMMCTYPLMGHLTDRFGIRRLTSCGALCACVGSLLLAVLAYTGLNVGILSIALFLRGAGIGAVGIPAMSAGYASVARSDIPMATTALNIVQRIGGPTITTFCATFLGWRFSAVVVSHSVSTVFIETFGLLCAIHGLLLLATLWLPSRLPGK